MTKKYLVVYAKSPGSNFSGHAPDVLGRVSVGDTLEEMGAMMREALESHFEVMAEFGDTIPEPAATQVEFKDEDFEDTEYFVVETLEVKLPANAEQPKRLSA
ncbi:MAG TPA: type II toxin-antitoxin system HicB family antitoxin [Alloacidobacterium sp.]|nr:type II toxin-antitoxin system HicB family antitoxin [Alloacidobacterium sp.]